jgi:hypothetical protein
LDELLALVVKGVKETQGLHKAQVVNEVKKLFVLLGTSPPELPVA